MVESPTSNKRAPSLNTEVDDPSHPLHLHRREVTDFEYGDILGEGSYSTVLVGKDKKSGKCYAIKRLDKAHIVKNNKVKYVMIERDALSKMNHPGIVKLYWTFKDDQSLYFVLDLAENGELYTFIKRLAPFDLKTAQFYAAEILLAIEYIHKQGVIHSILLDDMMHVKIADFGSAKIMSNTSTEQESGGSRSFVGTAEYVPPELLSSEPVSKEADFWAFGCIVYQMLAGKSPFKAPTDYLIFQKIKHLEYTLPDSFEEEAKDIVQKLLIPDPTKRLGAEGGIDAIKNHPFFDSIDWENIFSSKAPSLKEELAEELKRNPPQEFDLQQNAHAWFQQTFGDPLSDQLAELRIESYPPPALDIQPSSNQSQ
ncbi:pkb-activating kinase-like protein [Rhizopus stolonifer]|uniref:non-specific serine/threonine protein kinase n=1 Tax=Rhizopus stolonifer TaxID=4846 RepID=A0A367KWJ9_RHIST|nr:pkb-activating kinase-like protein [Rhizopus stolonifer]